MVKNMSKKDVIVIILKVVIYICTLFLGFLGASAFTSCSSPSPSLSQHGYIIVNDTIFLGR